MNLTLRLFYSNRKRSNLTKIILFLFALSINAQENPIEDQNSTEIDPKTKSKQINEQTDQAQSEAEPTEAESPTEGAKNTTGQEASEMLVNENDPKVKETRFFHDGKVTYANSSTKIRLTASEEVSDLYKIEYSINNNEYKRYKEPIQISEEGPHQIFYRSYDIVGNIEFKNIVPVIIDNTPPMISAVINAFFIEKEGKFIISSQNSPTLSAFVVDQYSGVKSVEYSINDPSKMQKYEGDIPLDTPGDHTILLRSTDNLDNTSKEEKIMVHVDAVPPIVTISFSDKVVEKEGKKFSSKNNKVMIKAEDNAAGIAAIYVKIDDMKFFQPYTSPITLILKGNRVIEAKAVDKVGNESEVVKEEIIIDADAPQTSLDFMK